MPESHTTQREELIFLLNAAAELEHSLACSYLFTAFSLKSAPDEGLTPEQLKTVRSWKRSLGGVAYEEMMHLAIVSNLLTAVGSAPHLDRPNFPHDCSYYLPEYQIGLLPFGETALRHFLAIEQPAGGTLSPTLDPAELPRVEGDRDNEIGPDPEQFDSQGDIYEGIEVGLRDMVARLGEAGVFIGPAATPALTKFLQDHGWDPVHDLDATARAIERIVTEGEGAKEGEDSHYTRFKQIYEDLQTMRAADPGFEPARPVLENPFARTPPEAEGDVNLIDDELAIQVSDLFNETYGAMLQILGRFFLLMDESEAEATTLCDTSLQVMTQAIYPIGELLCRLPAGPGHPGLTAGPSFVVHTQHPLPHKRPAWHLLRERFQELGAYTRRLAEQGGSAASLQSVADTLDEVANKLVLETTAR